MEAEQIKRIIEAAILVAEGPLDRDALQTLFDEEDRPSKQDLGKYLEEIGEAYADRGIFLKEVASGFRFQARPELGQWVSRLWQEKPPRYSRAILETLALIAYRQPITRGEIEEIRGVSVSSHIVKSLLERNWVRVVGHRDVPGRPAMFATTKQFLDYFDLKSLEDLPSLSEIRDLDKINEELALSDVPPANARPGDMDEAPEGEDGHGMLEGEREQRLPGDQEAFPGLEQEPEIDDDTLMSMDKVDSVLSDFEQEFRRKPAADKDKQEAVASDESVAEQAETADNSPNDADGEDAAAENSAEDSQTRHD
ncbi:MAG TPA: SMC-Scp complex subunit ScpB [Alcanivorax sp.]|uniref:Transcriptional regulator n=1 Tax=Alcanivorax jadensis T9 TaxID=1177181 RepID=A0ABR4WI78_9GAMM|nr:MULTISPECIES: SMC-Scp complex subunit ScpB [Alcanivorax]MAC16253.1 SMC-Scp complex subunit ScpB [Alcanivorax sp.]KGD62899.1 transcriptional regulator [Alcanivorax jadensis T9]MBP21590.1 SMC-Scp complex subunit ScpB [Alcanivorax sp.]MDF1638127.1 SMC-Scp complex subunit ScpB [Alcanivorax jadensis]HBC17306.1 SMC-Scp complex subunit ScpB [Alcanivorax sp.]